MEEKDIEIRLKTFRSQENEDPVVIVVNACCNRDTNETVTGICFIGQDISSQKLITNKYAQLQGDYAGLMRNPSDLIPPIFMMDEQGLCLEWNDAMEKLSGLSREAAIGRLLLGEIFTVESSGCRVKDHDVLTKLRIWLIRFLQVGMQIKCSLASLIGTVDLLMLCFLLLRGLMLRVDSLGFCVSCMFLVQSFNMPYRCRGFQKWPQIIPKINCPTFANR